MKSADAMRNAMGNATRAMVAMNRRMNLPQLQAIMRGFAMETERMDMTQVRRRRRRRARARRGVCWAAHSLAAPAHAPLSTKSPTPTRAPCPIPSPRAPPRACRR